MEEAEPVLMAGRDEIAVPELMVDIATRLARPAQDQRFFPGNLGNVLRGNAAERTDSHELGGSRGGGSPFGEGATREFERVEFRH